MISSATFNPIMTGHATEFMRALAGFVALRLFPAFPSGTQSGEYYVWERENALNVPTNIRHAAGTAFVRSRPRIAGDQFACKDYGHEAPVPDPIRAKYRNYIDADISAVRRNTDIIKINHEIRVRDICLSGSVPNATPSTNWNDPASDPKADVQAGIDAIRRACGTRPNLMVISDPVRVILSVHPKIADRVKYTVTGITNLQLLAAYFEIAEIAVADQVINSGNEGQTLSPADIWGDDVILAYVNPARDLQAMTFGRTFFWSDFGSGAADVPIQINTYRDETVESDVHRARHFVDEKLTTSFAAYRLNDVLS